jgi:hypothetical protein
VSPDTDRLKRSFAQSYRWGVAGLVGSGLSDASDFGPEAPLGGAVPPWGWQLLVLLAVAVSFIAFATLAEYLARGSRFVPDD